MLDALVSGERDREALANLARRQMRKKIPALARDQQIERLTEAIGEQIAPLTSAVELLCTITGVQAAPPR